MRSKLTGQRFGRLVVDSFSGITCHQKTSWNCQCDCGNSVVVVGGDLKSGRQISCGCKKAEFCRQTRKHKYSDQKEYIAWKNIIRRCYSPKCPAYKDYGGRGISVCESWRLSFDAFFLDMGPRPSKSFTVERLDNDGPYSKENCVWATRMTQSRNRRTNINITIGNETKCLAAWCSDYQVPYEYTRTLIRSGTDPLVALTRKQRPLTTTSFSSAGSLRPSPSPPTHRDSS